MAKGNSKPTPVADMGVELLLVIDEENLPLEWAEQPKRYLLSVREYATAEYNYMMHRLELQKREAELGLRFRSGDAGTSPLSKLAKVTEDSVKQALLVDPGLAKLRQEGAVLQAAVDIKKGLMVAFQQRERSLKYLQLTLGLPLDEETRRLGSAARRSVLRDIAGEGAEL
jgi:hypothetical protein